MMLIGWVVIGYLIYLFIGKSNVNLKNLNPGSPENILKERYVNGEIDEDTYLRMKETLKK